MVATENAEGNGTSDGQEDCFDRDHCRRPLDRWGSVVRICRFKTAKQHRATIVCDLELVS